jgi:hypothetical protein
MGLPRVRWSAVATAISADEFVQLPKPVHSHDDQARIQCQHQSDAEQVDGHRHIVGAVLIAARPISFNSSSVVGPSAAASTILDATWVRLPSSSGPCFFADFIKHGTQQRDRFQVEHAKLPDSVRVALAGIGDIRTG